MATSNLTIEQIEREVLRLGNTYPDVVYRCSGSTMACFYDQSVTEVEGLRGCIIRVALQKLGVSVDRFYDENGEQGWVKDLLPRLGVSREQPNTLLGLVQYDQDNLTPWGLAVQPLREKYEGKVEEGSDV